MEVGKKYKYNNGRGVVYECVARLDNGDIVLVYKLTMNQENYNSFVLPKEYHHQYVEYIEPPKPVVHRSFVYWLKNKTSGAVHPMINSQENAQWHCGFEVIHREEITFTEHPDTCNGNCTAASGQPCEKRGCNQ